MSTPSAIAGMVREAGDVTFYFGANALPGDGRSYARRILTNSWALWGIPTSVRKQMFTDFFDPDLHPSPVVTDVVGEAAKVKIVYVVTSGITDVWQRAYKIQDEKVFALTGSMRYLEDSLKRADYACLTRGVDEPVRVRAIEHTRRARPSDLHVFVEVDDVLAQFMAESSANNVASRVYIGRAAPSQQFDTVCIGDPVETCIAIARNLHTEGVV